MIYGEEHVRILEACDPETQGDVREEQGAEASVRRAIRNIERRKINLCRKMETIMQT